MDFSAVPSSDELWSLSLPARFILLPGAASPTRQPGLWGRRRLVPRLSHEAPRGPPLRAPAAAAPRAPPASEALVPRRAPTRLHLCGSGCPGRSLPSQARAVLLPGPLVAARDSLRELRPPRRRPRHLGPDTESKMAPGARGRGLSPARLRPTEAGVCPPRRAHAGARCPAPREGLRLPVPGGRVAFRAKT